MASHPHLWSLAVLLLLVFAQLSPPVLAGSKPPPSDPPGNSNGNGNTSPSPTKPPPSDPPTKTPSTKPPPSTPTPSKKPSTAPRPVSTPEKSKSATPGVNTKVEVKKTVKPKLITSDYVLCKPADSMTLVELPTEGKTIKDAIKMYEKIKTDGEQLYTFCQPVVEVPVASKEYVLCKEPGKKKPTRIPVGNSNGKKRSPSEAVDAFNSQKKNGKDKYAFCEPDLQVETLESQTLSQIVNDPTAVYAWALNKIGVPDAWEFSYGSRDIKLCVTDTGVLGTHPDLKDNYIGGVQYKGGVQYPGGIDDNGHGTHCAGTIGAVGNNTLGIVGVNWSISILGCKFLDAVGSGATSDGAACTDWCTSQGVHIMSNSWGSEGYSATLYEAIDRARTAGILFLAAAGNSGTDIDQIPFYPASYAPFLDNVLSVAATDENDAKASWSSYGVNTVGIAAPGANIISTWLEGEYSSMSGTSMATPHVAGAAALLKAYQPSKNYLEIKAALIKGADKLSGLSSLVNGAGRLNVSNAARILTGLPVIKPVIGPPAEEEKEPEKKVTKKKKKSKNIKKPKSKKPSKKPKCKKPSKKPKSKKPKKKKN